MNEDVECPPRPPAKRRQLELALDKWLAMWAADQALPPSQRARAQAERARRKTHTPPKIMGFTGTREGMTRRQKMKVYELLDGVTEVHHGDCIGADATFHDVCAELGVPIVLHPPADPKLRAFSENGNIIRVEKPLPYLARDREIVKAATMVVGTPREHTEPPPGRAGGTWYTIRYARDRGKPTTVILPDGQDPTLKDPA